MAEVPATFISDTPSTFVPDEEEKDVSHQIAGREVPFNPAQYVAGGGGMAGISLIPAPGPARDNPLGSYIPETPDIKGGTILGQLAAAPVNVGKHLLEGMASPLGVATLGLGPIPRVAQGLIGAGFGVPAAVEGVKRVYRGTALADPQEAIEGALQAITGGLITGGAAHGALTKDIPRIPEPEKPPLIPPPKIVDVQPPQTAPVNLEVPEVPPSVVAAGESNNPKRFMFSPDKEVLSQAKRDLENVSDLHKYHLAQAAKGVVVGAPTMVDRYFGKGFTKSVMYGFDKENGTTPDTLYDAFEPTRELLRKKYGNEITLWRAQGQGKEAQIEFGDEGKNTLNYASREGAKQYMEATGRQLTAKAVPVDDIVAVHSPNAKYEEYIVLNRNSPDLAWTPESRQKLPPSVAPAGEEPFGGMETTPGAEKAPPFKGTLFFGTTKASFSKPSVSHAGSERAGINVHGLHLSTQAGATPYAYDYDIRSGRIIPVDVEINNPIPDDVLEGLKHRFGDNTKAITEEAKKLGYDGNIHRDVRTGEITEAVIFDDSQIKGVGKDIPVDRFGSTEDKAVSAAEVPVTAGAEPAKVEPNVTPEVTQGGVPPIIGMGGATLDEVVPTATSIKNASGDLERVGIGLKGASETVTHNMEEAWAKADTAEQNQPGLGANLAAMLKRDPNMGLTDVESALLLRHKVDLFNKLNDAAEKTHVGDEKARSAAQAIHDDLKIQYEDLLDAARDRGESWGREGRWRQAMLKDDFTFSSTDDFNRYSRSVKGEDLPGESITEADKKAKSVKEANDAADKSTKEVLDDITNQSGTPPVDRTAAEQRAIDAANKTVRENAIRIADLESKSRVAKTVAEQETLKIQIKAAQKAVESAQQQARESAVRLAREESKVKERARLDEQSKAAQKALDAASKTVRYAAAAKAELETKSRVATSVRERQAAKIQVKAAQKAIDAADKVHRSAAIALAKAQRALQDNPIKAVWDKVREYIQKGVESPDDIRTKVATDLGMNVDHVTRIMQQSAKTKRLMDQAWLNQQKAQLMRQAAKRWVKDLNTPAYEKAVAAIPRALFAAKVFGHGTVALGTHAPSVLFQPKFWNVYTRDFGKMYKMVANPAFYEQQVRDLVRRSNYGKAQRGGLDNNPAVREEFASKPTASFFGKLSGAGNRGYTILKILRQDMFDQMYSKLPRSMQVQDSVIQGLAKDINSSTGSSKTMLPPGSNIALFAPRLQISRFNQLVGDPITAFRTFADWKNASAGEKMFAQNQIKQKLWIGGTLLSALAANQGLLTAMGSKQKINGIPESMGGGGIDPLASDFLKFKIAGHDVAYGSALLNMAKLPVRLAYALAYEGKGSKFVHEDERWYKILGDFARSQASPFAGTVADLTFGRDFQGRPLPRAGFGLLPGRTDIPKRLALQGITKPYSWTEYGLQQFAPIPASEFLKEVWGKGLGMSDQQIEQYFKSFIVGAAMAGTGSRVTEDKKLEQSQ